MTDLVDEYRRLIEEMPAGLGGGIDLLLSQMSDNGQHMLRRCSIPHQFDKQVFRMLDPALSEAITDEVFDEICSLSTVTLTETVATMHDDVRAYLFGRWLQKENLGELVSISTRLVDYFSRLAKETIGEAHTGAEIQQMYHLIAVDQDAGFVEFEKLCRHERYRYRLHACETLIQLVREYDSVLTPDHRLWLRYHKAKLLLDLRQFENARDAFKELDRDLQHLPELHVRALWRLGCAERDLRNLDRSERYLREGLEVVRQHPQIVRQELRLAQALASVLLKAGAASDALEILEAVINLADDSDDWSVLAASHNSLGEVHRILGHPNRMIDAYTKSLQFIDQNNAPLRQAQVYTNLGGAYADQAEWESARDKLEKGRDMAREAGDSNGLAIAMSNLARVYHALGDDQLALESANKAVELFERVHNWHDAASTCLSVGRYFRREGDLDSARTYLIRAVEFFRFSRDSKQVAETENELEMLGKKYKMPKWMMALVIIGTLIIFLLMLSFLILFIYLL